MRQFNPTVDDVRMDVRCYATIEGTCSKHNTKLSRKKVKIKYWGVSGGNARWKYRVEDCWMCGTSGFKALPYLPGGKQ